MSQQQNNLVRVIGNLSQNQPLDNSQISQMIHSTQDYITFEKSHDPTLSGQALKTINDFQGVLQAADQLNQNKNADEKIQNLFTESAEAAKDLSSEVDSNSRQGKAEEVTQKGKEVGLSILSVLKLMVSSGEFRNFIDSFISIIQDLFFFNSDFGSLSSPSEEQKHELSFKFLSLLRGLKQSDSFNDRVRDILTMFKDLTQEAKQQAQQVLPQLEEALENPHISKASQEAKHLIEEFIHRPIEPFLEKVKGLFRFIRDHQNTRKWFDDFSGLLQDTLDSPEKLDEYDFTQRVEKLIDDANSLAQQPEFKDKYNHVFGELRVIAASIKDDPDLKNLQEKTTEFLNNFTYQDTQGTHFNTDLVLQLRQLVIPLFISQLDSILLPPIIGSNEDYDYCFDNLHFSGRDILPEMIEIHTRSDFKFNLQKLEADQARSFALLQVSHIKPKFQDIAFRFTRKTFPQLSDQGTANVAVTGEGITFKIILELSEKQGTPFLTLKRVFVDIASLQIDIKTSQHEFLTGLFTSLYEASLKNMIEQQISQKIQSIFDTIQSGVNDLFARYPPSRLKAALSQDPAEIFQAIQS